MRLVEFAPLTENEQLAVTKQDVIQALHQSGFEDLKQQGNVLHVLVQIPDGAKKNEFRQQILADVLTHMQALLPDAGAQHLNDPRLGSLGGVVFQGSPVAIVVKDVGKQGDNSAGVANEIELASLLQSVIDKYGTATVTFVDPRGKKLSIKGATAVEVAGRDTGGRKKSDVVLVSKGGRLPISIKKLDADMWESADSLFGARAREILLQLVKDKVVKLNKIADRAVRGGASVPVYELSKEIVMEPTEEEAMNAIFGSDLNPQGGVVIQTFKPEHFVQQTNNITVECHAVISNWADIPESHLMVWLLRNDSNRNSASLGIAGIRPLGVTLTRGIGRKGTKDVILVDKNGNVVQNPNV